MSVNFKCSKGARMFPNTSAETEWLYLINENYWGEQLIVPLLSDILKDMRLPTKLRPLIEKQINDEIKHADVYGKFVSIYNFPSSGYDRVFAEKFSKIESLAGKIFAVQGVLEGVALGAFAHRQLNWGGHPAKSSDRKSLTDEVEHVSLSYLHFKDLIRLEGLISLAVLTQIKADLNETFKTTFNQTALKKHIFLNFGVNQMNFTVNQNALRQFQMRSARILASNCERFLRHYSEAVKCLEP